MIKKNFVLLAALVISLPIRAAVINLHLPCTSETACQDMKTPDGKTIRASSLVSFSLTPQNVEEASLRRDPDGHEQLSLTLNKEAGEQFAELTAANLEKVMVVAVGERVLTAPVIKQKITGGRLVIQGGNDLKLSFLDEMPWLREKIARDQMGEVPHQDRSLVVIYGLIAVLIFVSSVVFAVRRARAKQAAE